MAVFAIYNYQFYRVYEMVRQANLFADDVVKEKVNEAFAHRQEILGKLLDMDYRQEQNIRFRSRFYDDKEYIHGYVAPPQDDVYVLRIANKRCTRIVTQDLKEQPMDDYKNCIVIIDNRPGIQRILIEDKKAAFGTTMQVSRILEYTFSLLLKHYSLQIGLMHLQNPKVFWDLTKDKRSYPEGFYKITFHVPHLNLERLRKVFDRVLVMSREVFDSDLEWSYKANDGGQLKIDEKNPYQHELIEWLMKDVGDENIKLFANNNKRKAIVVGRDSFLSTSISDKTFRLLEEEAKTNMLFSSAMNDIKKKTKTGIDPSLESNDKTSH